MALINTSTHFDSKQIKLGEDTNVRPNTKLVATILDDLGDERAGFSTPALSALVAAFDENEVEDTKAGTKKCVP